MVYTGKPSKACQRCRDRRLKCDYGRPHCQKCRAAHVTCPGYRDELDILFRDQTNQIIDKHGKAGVSSHASNSGHASTSSGSTNSDGDGHSSSRSHAQDRAEGRNPPDDETLSEATSFLFQHYLPGSSFEWVSNMYDSVSRQSMFAQVVHATALAAFSHRSQTSGLLAHSRSIYHHALGQLRPLVGNIEWLENTTLASILLMSHFEILLNDGNTKSITDNWSGHISGAFAIIQSRAEEILLSDEPLTRALTEQTIHNYNLFCTMYDKPRPASLVQASEKLRRKIIETSGYRVSASRIDLHILTDVFSQFRKFCRHHTKSDLPRIIRWAYDLDEQALRMGEEFSVRYGYKIISLHDGSGDDELPLDGHGLVPYCGVYHLYNNHHEARLWNALRMVRLTAHDRVVEYSKELKAADDMETGSESPSIQKLDQAISESGQTVEIECANVCQSAPQFLRKDSPQCTHAAAGFLTWPLFVAGRLSKGAVRDFARARLQWIGKELNIRSAYFAATGLDEAVYHDDWLQACYMF